MKPTDGLEQTAALVHPFHNSEAGPAALSETGYLRHIRAGGILEKGRLFVLSVEGIRLDVMRSGSGALIPAPASPYRSHGTMEIIDNAATTDDEG